MSENWVQRGKAVKFPTDTEQLPSPRCESMAKVKEQSFADHQGAWRRGRLRGRVTERINKPWENISPACKIITLDNVLWHAAATSLILSFFIWWFSKQFCWDGSRSVTSQQEGLGFEFSRGLFFVQFDCPPYVGCSVSSHSPKATWGIGNSNLPVGVNCLYVSSLW